MSRIITIGREFGSGGREIGKRLADQLQIAYYDHEIVAQIAEKTELAEAYVQRVVENSPSQFFPITIGRTLYPAMNPIWEQSNAIYAEQCNIIRDMAEKSDCVIVGRCADYILRDKNPFRLFIYASMEYKMARCRERAAENEHLSDRELRQHILSVDKNRARYYEFCTGQSWGDKLNYDLCVNTTNTPVKDVVKAIIGALL